MRIISFLILACVLLAAPVQAAEKKSWWGGKKASSETEATAPVATEKTEAPAAAATTPPAAAPIPAKNFRGVVCKGGAECGRVANGYITAARMGITSEKECKEKLKLMLEGCIGWVNEKDKKFKAKMEAAMPKLPTPPPAARAAAEAAVSETPVTTAPLKKRSAKKAE